MTHVGCPLLLFPATCTLRQALQSSYSSTLLSHFVHRVGTSHIPRFSSFVLLRLTSNQAKYQIVTKTHHAYHHNISQVLNLTLLIFVWHCLRSHCISLSLSSPRNSPQHHNYCAACIGASNSYVLTTFPILSNTLLGIPASIPDQPFVMDFHWRPRSPTHLHHLICTGWDSCTFDQ